MTPEERAAVLADNTRLAAELATLRAAQQHASNVAFCEAIPVNQLRLGDRDMAVALLDHFEATPIEFGEGEERASLADAFKAFLTALPERVSFGEAATHARAAETLDFSDAQAISDAATAYKQTEAAKGKEITHAQAVAAVTAKR